MSLPPDTPTPSRTSHGSLTLPHPNPQLCPRYGITSGLLSSCTIPPSLPSQPCPYKSPPGALAKQQPLPSGQHPVPIFDCEVPTVQHAFLQNAHTPRPLLSPLLCRLASSLGLAVISGALGLSGHPLALALCTHHCTYSCLWDGCATKQVPQM